MFSFPHTCKSAKTIYRPIVSQFQPKNLKWNQVRVFCVWTQILIWNSRDWPGYNYILTFSRLRKFE